MSCTCRSKYIHWMENYCKTIVMTIWPQFQFENIFNVFVFEMKELLEISVKSTNFIDKTAQTHEMTYLFFFFQVSKSKSNSRTRALTPNLRIQMNWYTSGWFVKSSSLIITTSDLYLFFVIWPLLLHKTSTTYNHQPITNDEIYHWNIDRLNYCFFLSNQFEH